jgi:hypothetical protein
MPRERLRNDAARARGEPAAVSDGGGGIGTGGLRQLVWVLLRTGLRGGDAGLVRCPNIWSRRNRDFRFPS